MKIEDFNTIEVTHDVKISLILNEEQAMTLHKIAYRILEMTYDPKSDFTLCPREAALLGSFMFGIERLNVYS